jgi:hypothetical protein
LLVHCHLWALCPAQHRLCFLHVGCDLPR